SFTFEVNEEKPGAPRTVAFDGAGRYFRNDNLNDADPLDPKLGRVKTYLIPMEAGQGYNIDQKSVALDAFLTLFDPDGKMVAEDTTTAANYNARLLNDPRVTGQYRLLASDFKKGAGPFTLDVAKITLPASAAANEVLNVKRRKQSGCDIVEATVPGLPNIAAS